MLIKISERATNALNELLLQNVSARVWQNFVAFSSVVIPGLHRAAGRALVGSNGLIILFSGASFSPTSLGRFRLCVRST